MTTITMLVRFGSNVKKCIICSFFLVIIFPILFTFSSVRKLETLYSNHSTANRSSNNGSGNDLTSYILLNQVVVLLPKRFCQERSSLLILVASSTYNFENRQTIRETWGSARNFTDFIVDVYFMTGQTSNETHQKKIEKEYDVYDDIIQERVVDTYSNLTAKSLIMLKVTETYCRNSTVYFMKTDDDMYVNTEALVGVLNKSSEIDLLLGHKYTRPLPKRDPRNKWYVPRSVYAETFYPDFLSGSAYVMSMDVVHKIYQAAFEIPLYFLEDVYITGMLANAAGVIPSNVPGFSPSKRKIHPCLITTHGYTLPDMKNIYASLKSQKKCEK